MIFVSEEHLQNGISPVLIVFSFVPSKTSTIPIVLLDKCPCVATGTYDITISDGVWRQLERGRKGWGTTSAVVDGGERGSKGHGVGRAVHDRNGRKWE
jgi:hypothetical protein